MLGLKLRPAANESTTRRWWPAGARFAADFAANRYMSDGAHVAPETALTFTRASTGWATDSSGKVHAFAPDQMRRTAEGLRLQPARSRLSLAPLALGSPHWSSLGATIQTGLPADGSFPTPCRVVSDGTIYARRVSSMMSLTAGTPVRIKIRYRAGTSARFGFYMQIGTTISLFEGAVGNLSASTTGVGTWENATNLVFPDGSHEVQTDFIPSSTAASFQLGVSPRSVTVGEYVEVLGAMAASGAGEVDWMLGEPANQFAAGAEHLFLDLPTGVTGITLAFADGAFQSMEATGMWQVPAATLRARLIRSAIAA